MKHAVCARFGSDPQATVPCITQKHETTATETIAPRLTGLFCGPISGVMLQHNGASAPHAAPRGAHLAHAAVMGLHAICCGLPALAMIAAAASGATSGLTLLSGSIGQIHHFLHGHEFWILAASAGLVTLGGVLELRARRQHRHGFPWLFAFSVLCFVANVSIIAIHRAV